MKFIKLSPYVRRLVERTGVAFVTGFCGSFVASGGSWSRAGVVAGVTGGLTAVYGLVIKPVGDSDQPGAL